mgnify:CR=1 FL=1
MANLKEFFNKISNNNRIYTREDIGNMSSDEFRAQEKAIDYQLANLGVPTNSDMALSDDVVYVHSYTRDDGTKVKAHYRSKHGYISGAASNIENQMTPGEKTLDILGHGVSKFMPVAGANLQNARRDFDYAKDNENAHIINSRSEIKNKGLNDLMDKAGIPKNSRGVVYDINSKQSKKLFNSPEIKNYISENYSKLLNNKQNNTVDIEFRPHSLLDDNYLGIQHCKLYNPHITSEGYFNAMIIDYFDFNYRKPASFKDYKSKINNWGYSMQEKGLLENQFSIYQIREKLW